MTKAYNQYITEDFLKSRENTVNDNYRFMGWICKYNKTDRKFEVFSSELGITKHNDCFKSLRAAKKFVKNRAQLHFEGIVNDENI